MQLLKFESKDNFISKVSEVIIFGAGNTGKDAYKVLTKHGIKVRGFIDSRGVAQPECLGLPVWLADKNGINAAQATGAVPVVIAVFNRDVDPNDIQKNLKACAVSLVISFFELYNIFSDEFGERFWLSTSDTVNEWNGRVEQAKSLLRDKRSVEILDCLVQQRLNRNFLFPSPDPLEEQYLANDIPVLNSKQLYSRFIDCGTFDGDSLDDIYHKWQSIDCLMCFEPDTVNFAKLARKLAAPSYSFAEQVLLWPCGVWSNTTQLRFSSGGGEASCVSSNGSCTIQTVSIDEALIGGNFPTFIKMDIEGAEHEALLGAQRTIVTHKPALALSVYHKPDHLLSLMELVQSWHSDYQFYLRSYGHQGFDTVLYAINNKSD